ncbi:UDP-N-acetylglucosamine 1-carboxyvinyltransferase [Candidatus Gracilibacteria bacterium]|nr:UDP-N-acetylglucosamine 1-carboxyvinyltransferase [Candidatus Gracilibacteria bacterium]
MSHFVIHGGVPLKGTVQVGASKNAMLPILAATLLTDELCILNNVPDIKDTHSMLAILKDLGSEFEFKNHTITIQTKKIKTRQVNKEVVSHMRASILLLGPMLARLGKVSMPYPGGCVLGARSIDTHLEVLRDMGVKWEGDMDDEIVLDGKPKPADIVLKEMSVTATENAVIAASLADGETTIRLAAIEPHVQDLCRFLIQLGVDIKGIGTHTLVVSGKKKLHGATYRITSDYLQAGTLVLAALLTKGTVTIQGVPIHDLDVFWNLLREMGAQFTIKNDVVTVHPTKRLVACKRLQTNVFPGFPTDLQPPFTVLLTQAQGTSYIHEALFEGRFAYVSELKNMGADIRIENPHEAYVEGPTPLSGMTVRSFDLRAGAAMILAGLVAKGKTTVTQIQYIDRGYEDFDETLQSLGAKIHRVDD